MTRFGVGQGIARVEDARFLTGDGRFTDDIALPGQAFAALARSPHAHARIAAVETGAARAMPGVLAVYTAADAAADGLAGPPCIAPVRNADGTPMVDPGRPVLAEGRVRHVGEAVAMVVAETRAAARDAADAVEVAYEPLPAVVDAAAAIDADAPAVWDTAPGNLCFDWRAGDAAAVERAFADAAHVAALDLVNNRLVVNSMEGRAAIGAYDAASGRYTLTTSSQGAHRLRGVLARRVLGVPEDRLRVVTPDVGGGFGMKYMLYVEQILVLWAARKLGRPVRWTGERGESFVSDSQGRDHVTRAEAALDAEGRILALRVNTLANLGAYLSGHAPIIPTELGAPVMTGAYAIPAVSIRVRGVFTHTVPVDAYRGAGRPEAIYLLERLVDTAARELGLAPDEMRRRNFVPRDAMPFTTAGGLAFEDADFARNLDDALRLADRDGFAARRRAARERGRLRGFGMAAYIEWCGGAGGEEAAVEIAADGAVTLHVGTQASGQGHETVFAQLVAERLGVPFETVRVAQGDTDVVRSGQGTAGSRSMVLGGSSVIVTVDAVIAKARAVAAQVLEAAEADIEHADGGVAVAGTDRRLALAEVAAAAADPAVAAAAGVEPGLRARLRFEAERPASPNGCHVCEVEIDPETGAVAIVGYAVVDDFGRVINPPLVDGQVHGGVAQGIGQAVFERCVYEPESGQLLTASFQDYCLPRAADLPFFATARNETPTTANPLGVKCCGEVGAIGAPPAVVNAIVDALSAAGVTGFDMPATPERVWRAIRDAAGA